ncbi:5'/3'-nucleotidase SurE [Arachidicoccus ginsenosidivorans]|jgi:5'-nucleotidase
MTAAKKQKVNKKVNKKVKDSPVSPVSGVNKPAKSGVKSNAKTTAKSTAKKSAKNKPASSKNKGQRPVILITNDDSIHAPGIRALVEAVASLGEVVVVAPDKPQSGMGHAITIGSPLRLAKVSLFGAAVESYTCSGTPVDCVKLAVDRVLHRKPDICLSGINHGANHSINVIYSGTMSAALEASIEGIPSLGLSLLDPSVEADFAGAQKYTKLLVESLLNKKLDKHLCLNVNFPAVPPELIKGVKTCRQAYAKYEEDFEERIDPAGKKYYWLTGEFVNFDEKPDTDVWALANNYVSVVPVQFDLTNYRLKEILEKQLQFDS